MNGLKYIRTRCNLSLKELADEIGVTRQALSSWENERKGIPSKRKRELAYFFGVDESYFGNISDKGKRDLLEKAMFLYREGDKEIYRYKYDEDEDGLKRIYFLDDNEISLDERFIEAQKQKKTVIENIDRAIKYTNKGESIESQIGCINRGCNIYGMFTELLEEMKNQKIYNRVAYFEEVRNVLNAMLIGYGLIDKESVDINEGFKKNSEWVLGLAEILKEHWEKIMEEQEKENEKFKKLISNNLKNRNEQKSNSETIACAIEENKVLRANKEIGTSAYIVK